MNPQGTQIGGHRGLSKAIEAGWLLAAVLIPVAITHEDFMVGWVQMPKVFVLRTAALYLVVMVAFEWALNHRRPTVGEGALPGRPWRALLQHPARLVYFGAAAVLAANLVSIAFAPVKSIAIWGIDPGWDTYGFFNVAAYLVIFGVVATHLRTGAQLRRLVWALTATSMAISVYGIGQHFGFDPFRRDPVPLSRVQSTFGNPMFLSSYLLMTLPLTVGLFMSYRDRMSLLWHISIGAGLIALQATAIILSLSRGPWVGVGVGEIVFVILIAWVVGLRNVVRRLAIAGAAGVIVVGMIALPVAGSSGPTSAAVVQRAGSYASAISAQATDGGLSHRYIMWKTAAKVYLGAPWVNTELAPDIPALRFRQIRPLIGYGPDMFRYAYHLAGESTYTVELASHGHNFIVHTALELGALGVLAYWVLAVGVGWSLFRMLRAARSGRHPAWFNYLVVGVASAFAGRFVEQLTGKAQVADLSLSWMLAGVLVAMSVMHFEVESATRARVMQRSRRGRPHAAAAPSAFRIVGASVVALVVLVFWVQTAVADVRSARVMAQAQQAGSAGLLERAGELAFEAREIAPAAAMVHLSLGDGLFDLAGRDGDEREKVLLLEAAYLEIRTIIERNPLDYRAWSRAIKIQRELSLLKPDAQDQAMRDTQVLIELLPGFWQSHVEAAEIARN